MKFLFDLVAVPVSMALPALACAEAPVRVHCLGAPDAAATTLVVESRGTHLAQSWVGEKGQPMEPTQEFSITAVETVTPGVQRITFVSPLRFPRDGHYGGTLEIDLRTHVGTYRVRFTHGGEGTTETVESDETERLQCD